MRAMTLSTEQPDAITTLQAAELQWQDDGAPFSARYGDVYFSRSGGLAETRHVFLEANALQQRWRELDALDNPGVFTIAELGFGTGLNFLACWQLWQQTACQRLRLHFISCEKHPLSNDALRKALQQWPELADVSQHLIQQYPPAVPGYHRLLMSRGHPGDAAVTLDLYYGDALTLLGRQSSTHARVDAWFLDGFSPGLNPDLWSEPLMDTLARLSHRGTTLSSYSVTGRVVRYLKALGFNVEKRQGFGHKRHMLFARFEAGQTKTVPPASAIVIGAGLAGATVARALALRGVQVQVLEQFAQPASGASGNRQAVVQLRLNKHADAAWSFHLHSYLYALRYYDALKQAEPGFDWHACGVLTLESAYTFTKDLSVTKDLAGASDGETNEDNNPWQHYPPGVLSAMSAGQIQALTGLAIADSGLWQPAGGWINPGQCVRLCLDQPNITTVCSTRVTALCREGERWQVHTENLLPDGSTSPGSTLSADCVVVANSYQARAFEQTAIYPVLPLRGQVSHLAQTPASQAIRQVICGQRYLAPADADGLHCAGASYVKHTENTDLNPGEHQDNLDKLGVLFTLPGFQRDADMSGRASIRGASQDYLPIAGAVADASQTRAGSDISDLPGLYLSSGHGSHGTVSCPLIAEHLAALICHEASPLPQAQSALISPARFVRRLRKRQNNSHSR